MKDPSYTLQKVNQVLEKNCERKRKRQRRLEFMWDLITGKKSPPTIPDSLFEKTKENISNELPNTKTETIKDSISIYETTK